MLKLADIKFPITFEYRGVGHFSFTDENTCTKFNEYGSPDVSTMEIEHFIEAHNKHYNSLKDYGYAMPGYTCLHYKPYKGQVLPVRSPERAEITMVPQGAIEDMPLGASIIGIKDDNGDWQDVSFPVKQIEVHDDLICLLAHHGSYRDKAFAAELNIKRGTMVKWKVKA